MITAQEATLANRALDEIDDLLNNYDGWTQIRILLPLLHGHRGTLVKLQRACSRSSGATLPQHNDERWVDDLVTIYRQLGGQAPHSVVYPKMKDLRQAAGRSWPKHAKDAIRQVLQAHCAESRWYRGGPNLFRMIRRGLWGLK